MGTNDPKPLIDLAPKKTVLRMNVATQLFSESTRNKQRDGGLSSHQDSAFPGNPNLKVQNSGRIGQRDYNLSLNRQAVKGFAGSDRVPMLAGWVGTTVLPFSKPEVKVIKEMKSRPADQMIPCRLILRSEKDGCCEDALRTLQYAPVVTVILGKREKVQNLSCAFEVDRLALLPKGKCSGPNGNQEVLAKR